MVYRRVFHRRFDQVQQRLARREADILSVDLVLDPKKDIKEIEQIEVYVGIGYKEPALFPIGQYFYLLTKA